MRRLGFYFLLLGFYSCLQIEVTDHNQFPNNTDTLIAQYGEPLMREKGEEQSEFLHYPQGLSFEIKDQSVLAKHVVPQAMETSLAYWKDKFNPYESNFRELSGDVRRDGIPFQQLIRCDRLGIHIIYDPGLQKVTKIIYVNKSI